VTRFSLGPDRKNFQHISSFSLKEEVVRRQRTRRLGFLFSNVHRIDVVVVVVVGVLLNTAAKGWLRSCGQEGDFHHFLITDLAGQKLWEKLAWQKVKSVWTMNIHIYYHDY
jgi:hypothetical protein